MKVVVNDKNTLTEAVAGLIEKLHQKFPGITTKPITPYEDEDFALEVATPKTYKVKTVEDECNRECIKIEDRYDVYILIRVVSEIVNN